MRCRHSKWWNVGNYAWCPECGAIRQFKPRGTFDDVFVFTWSRWLKPDGAKEAYIAWEKMTQKP